MGFCSEASWLFARLANVKVTLIFVILYDSAGRTQGRHAERLANYWFKFELPISGACYLEVITK